MKKVDLPLLWQVTQGTDGILNLQESRIRDAFMKVLNPATQQYEKDLVTIYEKFAHKTEETKPGQKTYNFPKEKIPDVEKEVELLNAEEVDIAMNPILAVVLAKTAYKPKTGETETIDRLLSVS